MSVRCNYENNSDKYFIILSGDNMTMIENIRFELDWYRMIADLLLLNALCATVSLSTVVFLHVIFGSFHVKSSNGGCDLIPSPQLKD